MENVDQVEAAPKRSVFKRLMDYAALYKFRIAAALLVLICAVGAELGGPFIGKIIIDKHIGSVALPWYETEAGKVPAGMQAVQYDGKAYVRSDWTGGADLAAAGAKQVSVAQLERHLYVVREPVDGAVVTLMPPSPAAETDRAKLTRGTVENIVPAYRLSAADVANFYRYDIWPVMKWLSVFIGLLVTASVLHFVQGYTLQSTAHRIIQRMRMDLMEHVQRIPVRYFDNTPIGQVVSRIANDTEAIRDLFMSFMATFVVSSINIIGIYIALFLLDVKLALVTLVLVPLFVVVMIFHLKYSKKYIAIMRARLSDMNVMLNESIHVMPMLQAFRREKERQDEFERLNMDRYTSNIKQIRVFSISSRNFTGFVGAIFTASAIWYFGSQSLHQAVSFGVFYAFIDYLGRFFQPIIGVFDQITNAQRAIVSAEKVFHILDLDGTDIDTESDMKRPQGHVKFDNVTFAYNEGEPVLKGITFEAKQGETVALVGHTGSGKSSIMNLLLGFYESTSGRIAIDGHDIKGQSKQALRKHMGVVLQDPFLFAGDIKFNVSLYNQSITLEQVKKALKDVGASDFIEQLPGGYHETVVERGSTLSAGQRQLISFARALAYDPSILILDEATASIDSETEGLIQRALRVLSQGRTTFVIAHRLSTIREANLILVLHRGEIVERGTHDELMQQRGRYFKMHQLQTNSQETAMDVAQLG
jgi:ATP-binding cassette subfamily B multidrug efflux pump